MSPEREILARVAATVEHMSSRLDTVHDIVTGGSEPNKGLISQVQNHEFRLQAHDQDKKSRARFAGTLIAAAATSVVGALVTLAANWRGGGGPPTLPHP